MPELAQMGRATIFFAACVACAGCGTEAEAPHPASRNANPAANTETGREQKTQRVSQGDGPDDGQDYLPLEVGRVMRYEVSWSPPVGETRSATAVGEVPAKVEIAGKTYYKQVTKISGIPFSPTTVVYYRPTPQGVYQILEGEEDRPEWLYLPRAIEVGDTWSASTSHGELEFTAVGKEDVDTPSGDYRGCWRLSLVIKSPLGTVTEEQWLAPGVGFVKQVDRNPLFTSTTLLSKISGGDDGVP